MKQKLHFTLSFILLLVVFNVKAQTTDTFNPNKYNTIYQSDTENLSNGAGDHIFAGNSLQGEAMNTRRGLLSFDLSSIPSNATITDVKLTLFMSRSISGAANVSLHKASSNWGQGTSDAPGQEGGGAPSTANDASWSCNFSLDAVSCITSWSSVGGDFVATPSSTISVDGGGSYEWNSPELITNVQSWVETPSTNFGWFILGDETVASAKRFDATAATQLPVLEVTYTNSLNTKDFSINDFSITPNPSKSSIRLVLPNSVNDVKVQAYDLLGKKIYSSTYFANSRIDISNWSSGVYLIKVFSESNVITKRFIKN